MGLMTSGLLTNGQNPLYIANEAPNAFSFIPGEIIQKNIQAGIRERPGERERERERERAAYKYGFLHFDHWRGRGTFKGQYANRPASH